MEIWKTWRLDRLKKENLHCMAKDLLWSCDDFLGHLTASFKKPFDTEFIIGGGISQTGDLLFYPYRKRQSESSISVAKNYRNNCQMIQV